MVAEPRIYVRMVATTTDKGSQVTRHGKRAKGMALVSFPCPRALKQELMGLAKSDERTLSAYLRIKLHEVVRRSRAARGM